MGVAAKHFLDQTSDEEMAQNGFAQGLSHDALYGEQALQAHSPISTFKQRLAPPVFVQNNQDTDPAHIEIPATLPSDFADADIPTRLNALSSTIDTITQNHAKLGEDAIARRVDFDIEAIDKLIGGGLSLASCHEIRAEFARDIGATTGLMLALLARISSSHDGKIIWVSDAPARFDSGLLCPHGLAQLGLDPGRFVFVQPPDLKSALWAFDEASKCSDVMAGVFQLSGNPKVFDLTATRRLALHARQSGATLFILRQSGGEEASNALTRWRVKALNSLNNLEPKASSHSSHTSNLIGPMRLALSLEKNRDGPLGEWAIAWNHLQRKFFHAAPYESGKHNPVPGSTAGTAHIGPASAATKDRPHFASTTGQVVAFATRPQSLQRRAS